MIDSLIFSNLVYVCLWLKKFLPTSLNRQPVILGWYAGQVGTVAKSFQWYTDSRETWPRFLYYAVVELHKLFSCIAHFFTFSYEWRKWEAASPSDLPREGSILQSLHVVVLVLIQIAYIVIHRRKLMHTTIPIQMQKHIHREWESMQGPNPYSIDADLFLPQSNVLGRMATKNFGKQEHYIRNKKHNLCVVS